MRLVTLASAIALALATSAAAAHASTVYHLDLASGGTSAIGTITTDGATGTLGTANITDWNILLASAGGTFTLNGAANSQEQIGGAGVTATATGLFFDFSATDGSYLIFQNPAVGLVVNYLCFNDANGSCSASPGLVRVDTPAGPGAFSIGSGVQQIASTLSATPIPASLPLFISALGSLGVLTRCRKRGRA